MLLLSIAFSLIMYKYLEEGHKKVEDKMSGEKTKSKKVSLRGFSLHMMNSMFGGHPALDYQRPAAPPLVHESDANGSF